LLMYEEKNLWREASVFAHVLGRLMEVHLPRVDEETALELADFAGMDREAFRARLRGDSNANPGDLSQLAYELQLSEEERRQLAMAYAFERDSAHEVGPVPEEEELAYLTERVGMSPEEAARILEDADLFITTLGSHYAFEPEEAVRVWGEAETKLDHLAQAASLGSVFGNLGVEMLLFDAATRATKLRKRAQERVGGA